MVCSSMVRRRNPTAGFRGQPDVRAFPDISLFIQKKAPASLVGHDDHVNRTTARPTVAEPGPGARQQAGTSQHTQLRQREGANQDQVAGQQRIFEAVDLAEGRRLDIVRHRPSCSAARMSRRGRQGRHLQCNPVTIAQHSRAAPGHRARRSNRRVPAMHRKDAPACQWVPERPSRYQVAADHVEIVATPATTAAAPKAAQHASIRRGDQPMRYKARRPRQYAVASASRLRLECRRC